MVDFAAVLTSLQWRDRTGLSPVSLLADGLIPSEPFVSSWYVVLMWVSSFSGFEIVCSLKVIQ